MDHDELPALADESDWLHERVTRGCPVAGVHVDVLGPEAGGAVVRVTVARDPAVAVGATEVLAGARKAPRQKAPRFVEPNGARRRDPSAGSPSRARTSGRRSRYLLAVRLPVDLASGIDPWLVACSASASRRRATAGLRRHLVSARWDAGRPLDHPDAGRQWPLAASPGRLEALFL
jgi:hypothetical protein